MSKQISPINCNNTAYHHTGYLSSCIKNLAEAILLQTIEDIWDKNQQKTCLTFFNSRCFSLCADIAGISIHDRNKILSMIQQSLQKNSLDRTINSENSDDIYHHNNYSHSRELSTFINL